MSEGLNRIAARYASALKRSEVFTASDGYDRPSPTDIWLYKLVEVVGQNVEYRKGHNPQNEHDQLSLHAHRHCLRTKEDVLNAPDKVLFETLNLDGNVWGWLEFMVSWLGFFSILAKNWGWPVLVVGM